MTTSTPSLDVVFGLLGQRLGRTSTPATEHLEPSRHAPLFREHAVFRVRARDFDAFPHCRLARSSSSVGLCACDGETLTYLHALEPEALGRVLEKEGSVFFEASPLDLAALFAELSSEGLRPLPVVLTGPDHEAPRVEVHGGVTTLSFICEGAPRPSDIGRVEVRVDSREVKFDMTLIAADAVELDEIEPF